MLTICHVYRVLLNALMVISFLSVLSLLVCLLLYNEKC